MLDNERRKVLNRALRERLGAETIIQIEEASTMTAKTAPAALTEIERKAIQGILDSDYMDGMTGQDATEHHVWSWSANPFPSKRTFSGAISSLVQKGYVRADNAAAANERTLCITQAGMDAFLGRTTTHITAFHDTAETNRYGSHHQVLVHFAKHPAEVALRFKTPEEADKWGKAMAERLGLPFKP